MRAPRPWPAALGHRLREHVIPKPAVPPPPPQLALDFALADDSPASSPSSSPRPRRIAWAKLLARLFAIDITRCRAARAGLGRLRAEKDVAARQWFFKAHCFQDPVQPGSLGIEAMLQALQALAIDLGLGEGLEAPRFETQAVGITMRCRRRRVALGRWQAHL